MKRVLSSITLLLVAVPIVLYGAKLAVGKAANTNARVMVKSAKSGTPLEINYQGWLGSSSDTTAVSGAYNMTFRIYDASTGGDSLWGESQSSVQVVDGIFNVLIGNINPLPSTIFDGSVLYLETQVGSDVMSPRKALVSVAYAIKAKKSGKADTSYYADTADYVAGANVNGKVASSVRADTATYAVSTTVDTEFVKKVGDAMTGPLSISASASSDMLSSTHTGTAGRAGSFLITNTSNSNAALYGYTAGGGSAVEGSSGGSGIAVNGYTNGTGNAGYFQIDNASNAQPAVRGSTNGSGYAMLGYTSGTGNAGYFVIDNASNAQPAVWGSTTGSGDAMHGYISGNGNAVYGWSDGSGNAVKGYTDGTGKAGDFEINNATNGTPALYGSTNGTGNGVYGSTTGSGNGVFAYTNGSGKAVWSRTDGTGNAGYFQINNSSDTASLVYLTSNGTGNYISASNGAHLTNGGVWTNGSSRSYKENIKEMDAGAAIKAFEELNPVTFKYKTEKDHTYCGFIAEDVPELVAMKDRKSLSSMDIVAVLTKVVQEQQKEIKELKSDNDALRQRMDRIEKR